MRADEETSLEFSLKKKKLEKKRKKGTWPTLAFITETKRLGQIPVTTPGPSIKNY